MRRLVLSAIFVVVLGSSLGAQVYRYFKPGTVWTFSGIRITSGMDQSYLQYLDGQFKRLQDAQVKAGYMKSYKIFRTFDDDANSWNLLIVREYASLASLEANEEKADELTRQLMGDDQAMMKASEDRSKVRTLLWTKTAQEVILK